MLDSVRVGGVGSGGIILDSVLLVCCKSLHFCHYVDFGSGVPGLYAFVASTSIMEAASSRSADTYHSTLLVDVREYGKATWPKTMPH